LRPTSIFGLALYGSAAFMYMFALRKIPVSWLFQALAVLRDRGRARILPVGEPFASSRRRLALIMGGVLLINQT